MDRRREEAVRCSLKGSDMGGIFEELGYNSIITADAVLRIKSYIASRHPGASVPKRAMILADALNKAVDPHIPKLDQEQGRNLKRLLFEHAAAKPTFSISGSDVFQAAMEMKVSEEVFYNAMEDWLSVSLDKPIPKEQLVEFVRECHVMMFLNPGKTVREIAEEADEISEERFLQGTFLFADASVSAARMEAAPADPAPTAPAPTASDEAMEPYKVLEHFKEVYSIRTTPKHVRRLQRDWKKIASSAAAAVLVLTVGISFYLMNGGSNVGMVYAAEAQGSVGANAGLTVIADEDVAAGMADVSEDRTIRMKATAYDLSYESCGKRPGEPGYGITSSGTEALVGRTVAVDPEVIPLGSKLRITFPKEYSHLDGEYTAEDTGRLIKGNTIDIFFGEDTKGSTKVNKAAMEFGIRSVEVRILE